MAKKTPGELTKASVQEAGESRAARYLVFQLAMAADEAPRWWSKRRDQYLRAFWPTVPFLAGAIYSIASRNAAFDYELSGPDDQTEHVADMLAQADLGKGWQSFIIKLTTDLLTQDNGAFIEVIRPARVKTTKGLIPAVKVRDEDGEMVWMGMWRDKLIDVSETEFEVKDTPLDQPIGIAHLDSGRCQRTGDPEYPVIYEDVKGRKHKLNWWQVITMEDMPSPIEDMHGVGLCGASRVMRAAQILRDIATYKQEKVSGRHVKTVYLTNVDAQSITDAIDQGKAQADAEGLVRYMQPIIAATIDPQAAPAVAEIHLASLPEGWDEEISMRWFVTELAMGFGVDYGFFAPLPGKGLGTASQSEVMARQARGKSSRMFMETLSFKLKYGGVWPDTVTFEFKEIDPDEQATLDEAKRRRAESRRIRIESGEITPEVARQIANDEGDLEDEYLKMLEEVDITPSRKPPAGEPTQEGEKRGGLADAVKKLRTGLGLEGRASM